MIRSFVSRHNNLTQPRVTSPSIVRARSYTESRAEPIIHREEKSDIDVCLRCTKKECSGTKKCYMKQKVEKDNATRN